MDNKKEHFETPAVIGPKGERDEVQVQFIKAQFTANKTAELLKGTEPVSMYVY